MPPIFSSALISSPKKIIIDRPIAKSADTIDAKDSIERFCHDSSIILKVILKNKKTYVKIRLNL